MVAVLGALFLLAEAGKGLALNAADALFFLRFGVNNLPWMYIGLGLISFLLIIAYTAGLARRINRTARLEAVEGRDLKR